MSLKNIIEKIATIILASLVLTLMLTAAFFTSPYMGFAMLGVLALFSFKK